MGWRAKFGVLVPSGNSTMEPELYKMVPEGVSLHFSRLKLKADVEEELLRMTENLETETEKLADAEVDVICFGCTGGSLIKGKGFDKEIIKRIENTCNIPATTTSTAVINALNTLGIGNVSLASPYPEWLNNRVIKFIESHGVKVISSKCLNLETGMEKVPQREVYALAKEVNSPEADGIFISCTDFPTIGVITKLEEDLDKPVISSNQATLWEMLRMVSIKDKRLTMWGRLFDKL